eukprot:5976644-Ditylum_brightwellii.AAC.1
MAGGNGGQLGKQTLCFSFIKNAWKKLWVSVVAVVVGGAAGVSCRWWFVRKLCAFGCFSAPTSLSRFAWDHLTMGIDATAICFFGPRLPC